MIIPGVWGGGRWRGRGSQRKLSKQCSASGGRCGGRGGAGKLVIARIFPCSLVRCGTDCDISRIETLKFRADLPVKPFKTVHNLTKFSLRNPYFESFLCDFDIAQVTFPVWISYEAISQNVNP